jgi:uncharacterized membrane protein (UPF0127 family)
MAFLRNATSGAIIATRVERANNFIERAIGLLGRSRVRPDEGLWFAKCSAIHTLGMKITIDVIFVDAKGHILKLIGNVRPGLWSVSCRGARDVIELGGGALRECDLMPGDRLELVSA